GFIDVLLGHDARVLPVDQAVFRAGIYPVRQKDKYDAGTGVSPGTGTGKPLMTEGSLTAKLGGRPPLIQAFFGLVEAQSAAAQGRMVSGKVFHGRLTEIALPFVHPAV